MFAYQSWLCWGTLREAPGCDTRTYPDWLNLHGYTPRVCEVGDILGGAWVPTLVGLGHTRVGTGVPPEYIYTLDKIYSGIYPGTR